MAGISMLFHVYTHASISAGQILIQMDMHSLNFFSYCYITLYKGFASLHFHQYCIPQSCFLIYLHMLHVNHLLHFSQIAWQNCLNLHFFSV